MEMALLAGVLLLAFALARVAMTVSTLKVVVTRMALEREQEKERLREGSVLGTDPAGRNVPHDQ